MENRAKHRRKYDFQWPDEDEVWEKAKGRMRKRQEELIEQDNVMQEENVGRHTIQPISQPSTSYYRFLKASSWRQYQKLLTIFTKWILYS